MPSRKGPSQRDPMVRLSQAVRTAAPASMGGRVTNASVSAPEVRRATRAPAGGDTTHPGAGPNSTQVGAFADASGDEGTALGVGAFVDAGTAYGTAVGYASVVTASVAGLAVGGSAHATADYATAVGYSAVASADYGTAFGYAAEASATEAVALGPGAIANVTKATAIGVAAHGYHSRSIALGYEAETTFAEQAMVKADFMEITASSGSGMATSIVVTDSVTGTRKRISIASGVLTVANA